MGLQNLVGISLEQITPARETVKRLLAAATRHIAGAKVDAISATLQWVHEATKVGFAVVTNALLPAPLPFS